MIAGQLKPVLPLTKACVCVCVCVCVYNTGLDREDDSGVPQGSAPDDSVFNGDSGVPEGVGVRGCLSEGRQEGRILEVLL